MHRLASYQEQHSAIVKLNPNVDASRHRSNCISLGLRRVPGTNRTVSSRKTSKRHAFNPPIRFKVVTFVRGFNAMRPHYRTPRISFFTSMHFLLLPTSLAACRTHETVVYVKVISHSWYGSESVKKVSWGIFTFCDKRRYASAWIAYSPPLRRINWFLIIDDSDYRLSPRSL